MSQDFDRLFESSTEYQHPKLRYWVVQRDADPTHRYCVEIYRPRQGLLFGPARLYVHVLDRHSGEDVRDPSEMLWDGELDDSFIQAGFAAVDAPNEATRFALALRRDLMRPERRYGEGFFNAVLLEHLRQSVFGTLLEDVMADLYRSTPSNAEAAEDCAAQIDHAIKTRARQLTGNLDYDRRAAADVMTAAIRGYLDERFHVSDRRALGLGGAHP